MNDNKIVEASDGWEPEKEDNSVRFKLSFGLWFSLAVVIGLLFYLLFEMVIYVVAGLMVIPAFYFMNELYEFL